MAFRLAFAAILPAIAAAASKAGSLRGSFAPFAFAQASDSSGDSDRSQHEKPPGCSCDCCDVVMRLPGEMSFGAGVKCSPSTQHSSDMCGMQCSTSEDDHILQDAVVDMQRFCFFECGPAAGPDAPVQSQCVAFEEDQASKLVDKNGNPIDPALLYGKPAADLSNQPPSSFFDGATVVHGAAGASANLLSTRSTLSAPEMPSGKGLKGHPDSVDKAEAKKDALQGKASAEREGADARKEAAKLREMEHDKQKTLNKALKQSGDGVVVLDPFAAISDLKSATNRARVDADKAGRTAAQAVKIYDEGRQKIWKLALMSAGKEVLRWKAFAENKWKKDYEARFASTWDTRAIKAAQKASKSYIEGLLRAQDSVKTYNEKGFALAKEAQKLWKESQAEAAAANRLPRADLKQQNVAQAAILDAKNKAMEAQQMASESRQSFATAADVRKGIPQYQYNAQKAAAEAVGKMYGPGPGR